MVDVLSTRAETPTRDLGTDLVIGVSIAVPAPYAGELAAWRQKVKDPQARLVHPHITLIPPTGIDHTHLDWTERHLDRVCRAHRPFSVHLRGTGSFRPVSSVVFVTVANGISDCELLARDVRVGALRQPLLYPYHPHVTVAHNVADDRLDEVYDGLSDFSARFVVDRLTLHRQEADGHWEPIRTFALAEEE